MNLWNSVQGCIRQKDDLALSIQDMEELESTALGGNVHMLTPARELVLVHALRRPLQGPLFSAPHIQRSIGDTDVSLTLDIKLDRKTTWEARRLC